MRRCRCPFLEIAQGGASRLGPSLATAAGRAGSERRPKLLGFTLRGARVGEPPPACPSSAPVPCREPWLAFRSLPHSAIDGGEKHEKPSRGDNRSQVDQKNRSSLAHIGMPDRAQVGICRWAPSALATERQTRSR